MKSTTAYFKFERRFVPKVRAYVKRCTIRAARKRVPKVGDTAVLSCWSGEAYRSPQEVIGTMILTEVLPVQITAWDGRAEGIMIVLGGAELIGPEAVNLARDDGFESLQALADFFRHRLPFDGHFYEWRNPQETMTDGITESAASSNAEEYESITADVDIDGDLSWRYKLKGAEKHGSMTHDEDVSYWSDDDILNLTMQMLDVPAHQRSLIVIDRE